MLAGGVRRPERDRETRVPVRTLRPICVQQHDTGHDQEDQLQAHKPKIIPFGRAKAGPADAERLTEPPRCVGHLPRWHRLSAPTGLGLRLQRIIWRLGLSAPAQATDAPGR